MDPKLLVNLTDEASVSGKILQAAGRENPVYTFLGVPYAAPPVGERRFQAPAELEYWKGTRDATKHGPICPQDYAMSEKVHETMGGITMPQDRSEDCLYLNIYTPDPNPKKKYPVMVWIYGGAFFLGFSDCYDGIALASYNDVVFVSFNYRLGIFGFLCTGEDGVVNGNAGMLDQVAALQWVQQHIAKFGGDPDNVTIFGESAGAMSTSLLVVSDLARGLFHRAISESGVCTCPGLVKSQKHCGQLLRSVLEEHGFASKDSQEILTYLQSLPAEDLNKLQGERFSMTIIFDHNFLKDTPKNIYNDKQHQPVDHIIGFNSMEGAMGVLDFNPNPLETKEDACKFVKNMIESESFKGVPNASKITEAVCKQYVEPLTESDDEIKRAMMDMSTDFWFGASTIQIASQHSETGRTFVYVFDHHPSNSTYPEWVKGSHGDEIYFTLGDPLSGLSKHSWTDEEKQLSMDIMKYWSNFARTGDPNGENLPKWPAFKADEKKYMILREKMEAGSNYKPDIVSFWQKIIPDVAKSD